MVGNKTNYAYNADNEPIKTEEPNKTVTETEYDSEGQVDGQTDGNKHTTKYTGMCSRRSPKKPIPRAEDDQGIRRTPATSQASPTRKGRTTTYTYDPGEPPQRSQLLRRETTDRQIRIQHRRRPYQDDRRHGRPPTTTYDQLDRLTESERRPQGTTSNTNTTLQGANQDHLPQRQSRHPGIRQRRATEKGDGLARKHDQIRLRRRLRP